jgi:HD-GYP domain-containing protein (c-di-GMP phosphodiesterase class II)
MECSQVESFWLDLALPEHATSFNARMCMSTYLFTIDDMLRVAEIFATIIDRMSRFTATHSRSVSGVAVFLAKCLGFSNYELSLMRIAGLLHDLGKLSIPNDILEKSGPLTKEEQLIVRQHTFFTYRVLERIEKLENVAQWAAFHHETLDGLGYPFRRDENNMSLGSCVMCVADIFVALAENRPYRRKLPQDTITSIMRSMVENNKISSRLVELLFDHYRDVELIMVAMESFKEKSSLLEPHSNIA